MVLYHQGDAGPGISNQNFKIIQKMDFGETPEREGKARKNVDQEAHGRNKANVIKRGHTVESAVIHSRKLRRTQIAELIISDAQEINLRAKGLGTDANKFKYVGSLVRKEYKRSQ